MALSVVAHLIFFAAIINLELWTLRHKVFVRERQMDLVKVADVALPADRSRSLRSPVDSIDRADTSRLEFDPERADDVNLVSRSPRPTTQRGDGSQLPSARRIESSLKRSSGNPASLGTTPDRAQPPASPPVQINRSPQLDSPLVAQAPSQSVPSPPAPARSAGRSDSTLQGLAQAGSPRGTGSESSALGLQSVQAQYLAYVRAKIRKVNERIMPRQWIEDILNDKVSADFAVLIGRGGQIKSAQLARSTGYRVLDDVAKQAIYIASPFEGWPPDAGDTIAITVTVYYTPRR